MSWDVELVDENGLAVDVVSHKEGGIYAIGGDTSAELNVTYNYSSFYFQALNTEEGLRWLDHRKAGDCSEALKQAVKILGRKRDKDYWRATPGNAGHALWVLLSWATLYPNATFKVS
jgi:hypothetical protein